jgi:hypothetical protein
VDQLARQVAAKHGWHADWLNDGVRTYLSPNVDAPEQHELFRAYPSEATPGLRVFVPTAEYMLAMKLMALRIGPAEDAKDLDDILALMDIVGVETKEDIVRFASDFYPEARLSGKLHISLDELWRLRKRRPRPVGDEEPPRYLGRSGPPG